MGHYNCILIAYFLPATELAIHLILTVEGLHVLSLLIDAKLLQYVYKYVYAQSCLCFIYV